MSALTSGDNNIQKCKCRMEFVALDPAFSIHFALQETNQYVEDDNKYFLHVQKTTFYQERVPDDNLTGALGYDIICPATFEAIV